MGGRELTFSEEGIKIKIITLILLLWDLTTPCVVDHLWPIICINIYEFHMYQFIPLQGDYLYETSLKENVATEGKEQHETRTLNKEMKLE